MSSKAFAAASHCIGADVPLCLQLLRSFAITDLSNFYLDVAKDRLYIRALEDPDRRCACILALGGTRCCTVGTQSAFGVHAMLEKACAPEHALLSRAAVIQAVLLL